MLGALLAVIGAAAFGFNNASVRRGVVSGTVLQAMAITVPIGVPLFFLFALVSGQLFRWDEMEPIRFPLLAAAGVAHFAWGRYCNYRASKAMGANRAGPFMQLNLLITLVLALTVLGETLNVLKVLGIVLLVVGPMIMIEMGGTDRASRAAPPPPAGGAGPDDEGRSSTETETRPASPVFVPKLKEGYTFALLSSTGYGFSPVLVRAGLEGTGLHFLGGLVSYAAAAAVIGVVLLLPGRWGHVRSMDPAVRPWFLQAGVAVFLSQMFRYAALALAPVTVVSPIMRLSLVFRMVFAWVINRQYESFSKQVIAGLVVSFVGATLLALNIDFVASHVTVPDFLEGAAAWRWP